jgi:tetraacyldisaccharide 4'-kinase
VISVGNITVGGTGKTPHVEYLIQLLSEEYKVAVLSRGYKRKTKGFVLADINSTSLDIGDEPCQIKRKYPHIPVAVDANRVEGIKKLKEIHPGLQIILLDDAFQYRKIIPTLSFLLTDYHRPLYRDDMLPGGRMREWASSAKRADIMIVTKSPPKISEEEQFVIKHHYSQISPKEIYFTNITYGLPQPIYPGNRITTSGKYAVLLVTGIAAPKPLEIHISSYTGNMHVMTYPDHHSYTEKDIRDITEKWQGLNVPEKLLLTTEKDAVRLRTMDIPEPIKAHMYYIPITIGFPRNSKEIFEGDVMQRIKKHLLHSSDQKTD